LKNSALSRFSKPPLARASVLRKNIAAANDGYRFQFSERGEADACRSHPLDDSLGMRCQNARLLGRHVITDNHLAIGAPIGMLLVGWKTLLNPAGLKADPLAEMERIYKIIRQNAFPKNPGSTIHTGSARQELVSLQSGDPENTGIWREMIRLSQAIRNHLRTAWVKFDHTSGKFL